MVICIYTKLKEHNKWPRKHDISFTRCDIWEFWSEVWKSFCIALSLALTQLKGLIKFCNQLLLSLFSDIIASLYSDREINSADCVNMDCDAKKKCMVKDMDGTLLGAVGAVLPQSKVLITKKKLFFSEFISVLTCPQVTG